MLIKAAWIAALFVFYGGELAHAQDSDNNDSTRYSITCMYDKPSKVRVSFRGVEPSVFLLTTIHDNQLRYRSTNGSVATAYLGKSQFPVMVEVTMENQIEMFELDDQCKKSPLSQ